MIARLSPRHLLRLWILGAVFFLGSCVSDPAAVEPGIPGTHFDVDGHALHYVEAGVPGRPLIVFVHGTPGSWRAFASYLDHHRLQSDFHLVAVDRLGFGDSAQSGVQPSFELQARSISTVFALNQSDVPAIVVGHSLGGSIGARIAVDFPADVGALLSISAGLSPALTEPRWFHRLADLPVVRWLVPNDLGLANEEVLPLSVELAEVEAKAHTLDIPITIMQGGEDWLVHPGNADYAESTWTAADLRVVRLPESSHFFLWEQPELVVDEILRLAQALESVER